MKRVILSCFVLLCVSFLSAQFPRVYDFEVNPSWHQLTLYNYNLDSTRIAENDITVYLNKSLNEGGLGLSGNQQFYAYDFWNHRLIGLIDRNQPFRQTLRPGEARMISLHEKENNPQFISTNRHIMQGYLDLKNVNWEAKSLTLSGTASVVADDTYVIVVATNGYKAQKVKASSGKAIVRNINDENGTIEVVIDSKQNRDIRWSLSFSK